VPRGATSGTYVNPEEYRTPGSKLRNSFVCLHSGAESRTKRCDRTKKPEAMLRGTDEWCKLRGNCSSM